MPLTVRQASPRSHFGRFCSKHVTRWHGTSLDWSAEVTTDRGSLAPLPPPSSPPRLPSVYGIKASTDPGGPYVISAGSTAQLNGSGSTCFNGPCSYLWTVACPSRPAVQETGVVPNITTGPGAAYDISTFGMNTTMLCLVALNVTGEWR